MSLTEDRVQSAISQQAAEWFIANRVGLLSQPEREAFVAWLKQSPEHIREYLAVATLTRDLSIATKALDADLATLIDRARSDTSDSVVALDTADEFPARTRPRAPFLRYSMAAALGALVIGLSVALWRNPVPFTLPGEYETRHGEQRVWQLSDGSVVHLNSASNIDVRYTDRERLIEIERGQAFFKVVPDTARRFRVIAGNAEVIAVGTEFDVYRRADEVIITVVEGKVAVRPERTRTPSSTATQSSETLQLAAGERTRIVLNQAPTTAEPVDVHKAVAWVERQIIFEQRPLAEVTEEFNRYGRIPIEIEDATLRDLRVSGVFNAYDTESFVAFLRRLEGVDVETSPDHIRVRGRTTSSDTEPISAGR